MTTVNSIITDIQTILNTYLSDPYAIAGGKTRSTWCHKDKPLAQATYPRIQIVKVKKDNQIIDIKKTKWRTGLFNVYFYTKKGFKVTIDSVSYQDESLCEYWAEEIEDTLDSYESSISGTWGMLTSTSDEPIYLEELGSYVIAVTVRLFWFKLQT